MNAEEDLANGFGDAIKGIDAIVKRLQGAIVASVILLCAFWWWHSHLPPSTAPGYHAAAPAKQLSGMTLHSIMCPPGGILAYGDAAKKNLGLPAPVLADKHVHVLNAGRLPASAHPLLVTTLFNDKTRATGLQWREEPLPWLAPEKRGYFRIGRGIKTDVGGVWRLGAGLNLVQIKAIHLGLDGTLDSDGGGYVGGHFEWDFW